MASSSGRDKLRSRGQRVFAFGSSTPREASHIKQIPPKLRNSDSEKSNDKPEGPSLHDYIVKARSLSREGSGRSKLVFGSSTPRLFAHLDKIPVNQRAYDAKIPKKSATHSDFKAAPIRFNSAAPIPKPPRKEEIRHVITSKDDDIASEPDIVQDREEFLNELKKQKKLMEKDRKSAEKSRNETMSVPKMVTKKPESKLADEVKFAHAPEIVGNAQATVRIDSKIMEEAPIAVKNVPEKKMNDLSGCWAIADLVIEVCQLNDEISPTAAADKTVGSTSNGGKETVVDNLLAKVQQVVSDKNQKTDDASNKTVSEEIKEKVVKGVQEVKNVAKSIEIAANSAVNDTEKKIDSGIKSVENKVEQVSTDTKAAVESVVSNGENVIKNIGDVASDLKKDLTDDAKELKIGVQNSLNEIKKGLDNF